MKKLKIHGRIINYMQTVPVGTAYNYFPSCSVDTFDIPNATKDLRKITCKKCQNFFRKLIKKHWK